MERELYLAKRSKRFLARLIDTILLFGMTSIIYFSCIYNNVLDQEKINTNGKEIVSLIEDSDLFLIDKNGNYAGKSTFTYLSIDELSNKEITYNGTTYEVSLTKSLYNFYLYNYSNYNETNLTESAFFNSVLKIGETESNIKSFDVNTYKLTLIDESLSSTTKKFFLETFDTAQAIVINYQPIKDLISENQKIMAKALSYSIYVFLGFSFIFEFLIPICSPKGQTIGKWIFKLGLVNKEGYEFKKWKHVIRYLTFLVVDIFLTICTFGGVFLINFTMMQFVKKRRVIHDMTSGSVVIDTSTSIIFKNKKEEEFYNSRIKERTSI